MPGVFKLMKLPGTATQEENIHVVMGKLKIQTGEVFLDVGCGSGAISLAASRYTDKIYGLDLRPEAVEASKAKVPGGTFLCGEASEILPMLPKAERCFIGGTHNIESFLPILVERAAPGCIMVANIARIGMASRAAQIMKREGVFQEILQFQIFRGYDLAGDIALRPANPIFMVVGRC